MKKLIAVGIILGALAVMLCPSIAGAASVAYIDITATGSEINITCNETLWAVGTVNDAFTTENTGFTWGRITNDTSEEVHLTVNGNEMVDIATGAGVVWDLDGDGSPAAGDFSMQVGINDSAPAYDYDIEDFADAPFLFLVYDADDTLDGGGATWDFGLKFDSGGNPGLGNEAMVMSNAAGTSHAVLDADNGLVITASL